jgi:2-(3-amino-3-carboxypropyl)histidine synthase
MKILLQFPEGLKQKATEIAKKYEAEGHEVFLSASACYGACDIALDEARWIKADKIIHFGHNRFVKTKLSIPVEYINYSVDVDVESLAAALEHLKNYKTIALATTVQHIHQIDDMKAFFEKNGKNVLFGKGERADKPGQILGCDAGAIRSVEKNADAIVFVGNGMFHPLALDTDKPVFVFNPSDSSVKHLSQEIEKLRKKRRGAIAKALMCKRFGILISTKVGQFGIVQANWVKKELERRGFECAVLVANELEPLAIANFMSFDCLVNTACPRMADDNEKFEKPILNVDMLKQFFEIIDANKLKL